MFIGSTRINITYPGMERRCRLCNAPDHAAGNCPSRKCLACKVALGNRPAYHLCEAPTQASPPAPEGANLYSCADCPASFPNRRGLRNHLKTHDRANQVEARAAAHPLPVHQAPHHPALPSPSPQDPPHEDHQPGDTADDPVDDDDPMAAHISNLRAIGGAAVDNANWELFCQEMTAITAKLQQMAKLPPPHREPASGEGGRNTGLCIHPKVIPAQQTESDPPHFGRGSIKMCARQGATPPALYGGMAAP